MKNFNKVKKSLESHFLEVYYHLDFDEKQEQEQEQTEKRTKKALKEKNKQELRAIIEKQFNDGVESDYLYDASYYLD